MFVALGITLFYIIFVWFIFFKVQWLKFNIMWGIVSFWVGAHLLLIFLVALRFFQPFSVDSHVVRSTIQIVPRLTQPTILSEVLVEPNTWVTKGDPLYKFHDQRCFRWPWTRRMHSWWRRSKTQRSLNRTLSRREKQSNARTRSWPMR